MQYDENRIGRIAKTITVAFRKFDLANNTRMMNMAMNPITDPKTLGSLVENLIDGEKDESVLDMLLQLALNQSTPDDALLKLKQWATDNGYDDIANAVSQNRPYIQ